MQKDMTLDIGKDEAYTILSEAFPIESSAMLNKNYMEYYAYPQAFGNTGGPFTKLGGIYGQAFTTYTIEAWVCGRLAVLFCNGKVVKVTDDWLGVGSVRI